MNECTDQPPRYIVQPHEEAFGVWDAEQQKWLVPPWFQARTAAQMVADHQNALNRTMS